MSSSGQNVRSPRLAIVGSHSPLGKDLRECLDDIAFPSESVDLMDTEEYAGLLQEFGGEIRITQLVSEQRLNQADIALLACSPDLLKRYVDTGARLPQVTVNATGHPAGILCLDPGSAAKGILDVPHPVTIGLSRVLGPLTRLGHVVSLGVTVLQPASASGTAGIDLLQDQTVGLLNFQPVPDGTLQRAFNVVAGEGRGLRECLQRELRTLHGDAVPPLTVAELLVPAFHSNVVAATVVMNHEILPDDFARCWAGMPGIRIHTSPVGLSSVAMTSSEKVHVWVPSDGVVTRCIPVVIFIDNLRSVSAVAVRLAEVGWFGSRGV